jgi:hypothetical protein
VGRFSFFCLTASPTRGTNGPSDPRGPPRSPSSSATWAPLVRPPFFPFLSPLSLWPRRSAEPGAQRRRSNRASPRGVARGRAARLARTPRSGACTRTQERPRERELTPLPLYHQASEAGGASPRAPPGPGRRRARGNMGLSPWDPAVRVQKERRPVGDWRPG